LQLNIYIYFLEPVDTRNSSISLLTSDEDNANNDDKDDANDDDKDDVKYDVKDVDNDDEKDDDNDGNKDDDRDTKNGLSIISNGPEKQPPETPEINDEEIPNVTEWDKFQVHNYLLQRLPQTIAESLLVNVSSCIYIFYVRIYIVLYYSRSLMVVLYYYFDDRISDR